MYIGRQRYTVPLFLWYNASVDFLNRNLGTIEVDEGYINVVVNQVDDICQVVLETLVVILETMVESYSQYIKISIMEV